MADSWTQVDPQRPQRLECSSGGVTHRVITLVEKDSRLSLPALVAKARQDMDEPNRF